MAKAKYTIKEVRFWFKEDKITEVGVEGFFSIEGIPDVEYDHHFTMPPQMFSDLRPEILNRVYKLKE